ncbi:hypothetical protein [Microbulbifer halophilus]|uniref:Neutral/alkaline non-lysosomal ceramidase N-terminal domain-containing protein n=1 Tax=Microbulbifer halophilus TaxID=453963 RepID=A0ABW5EIP0_9GAMM|nr:hypothetical protein [Microbulbifer halophilus]MCW8128612.1 hypothetical protein [Microbulbifer halophilus]
MTTRLLFLLIILSSATSALSAEYRAGFAAVDITPHPGDKLGLVGGGTGAVESIGDPLYIHTAVLTDGNHKVALVSVDLLVLRETDFGAIEQQLQQRGFNHVMVAATHTHGGYLADAQLDEVRREIIDSVETAGDHLQPVSIGATQIAIDEAYNRRIIRDNKVEMLWTNPDRIPNRDVDSSLGIIQLRDKDEQPFLTIFNYSAHPVVTMDLERPVVSADYPGFLRRSFEEQVGGHTMFFMGAGGDINPYHADTKPFKAAHTQARRLGQVLADGAVRATREMNGFRDEGHFRFDTISFRNPDAEVGLLLLTPGISLAGFPGEYFDALGRQLKRASPVESTFFVGMSNGDLRYVPTAADAALGGYGAEKPSFQVESTTGETHVREAVEGLKALAVPPASE